MTVIAEPLHIGASDLLKGVEYTYCGDIDVKSDRVLGKKWKHRYGIISQGCLYIYANRKATKTDQSFSLKVFETAVECDPECGENICFYLRYKTAKAPLLFSCDTLERREKWIDKFCAAISEVQSTLYNVSADSGIGSAETVPRNIFKRTNWNEEPGNYDEVDQTNVPESLPVQACEDDGGYELPKHVSGAKRINKDMPYENVELKSSGVTQSGMKQGPRRDIQQHLMEELNQKISGKPALAKKPTAEHLSMKASAMSRERISQTAKPSSVQSPSRGSMQSVSSSFLSLAGPADSAGTEESLSRLSVRGPESGDNFYANEDDTDNSTDSDSTSPKTIYENPEDLESMKPHWFEKKDYFCDQKETVKRLLKRKPVGVFAVFSGASTQYELCVMTPHDLRYFRIHSQNDRVSLFRSHQLSNTFSTLDDLLSYYNANDLPSDDYSVKLLRGYNSMT